MVHAYSELQKDSVIDYVCLRMGGFKHGYKKLTLNLKCVTSSTQFLLQLHLRKTWVAVAPEIDFKEDEKRRQ